MCARYTLAKPTGDIFTRFGVGVPDLELPLRYNIAPTQSISVIKQNGTRTLEQFSWGLVPFWAKDAGMATKLLNARAETLQEKPSFRTALARRRCLIPADGFFEWRSEGKKKQPMYITLLDQPIFAFAGLWEVWKRPDESLHYSATIVTVAPNDFMAEIHTRMPAILTHETESVWCDPATPVVEALSLLCPYPSEQMQMIPVAPAVGSPIFDSPSCIAPLTIEQPGLF